MLCGVCADFTTATFGKRLHMQSRPPSRKEPHEKKRISSIACRCEIRKTLRHPVQKGITLAVTALPSGVATCWRALYNQLSVRHRTRMWHHWQSDSGKRCLWSGSGRASHGCSSRSAISSTFHQSISFIRFAAKPNSRPNTVETITDPDRS